MTRPSHLGRRVAAALALMLSLSAPARAGGLL